MTKLQEALDTITDNVLSADSFSKAYPSYWDMVATARQETLIGIQVPTTGTAVAGLRSMCIKTM